MNKKNIQNSKTKKRYFNGIKIKLIGGFLVPVILMLFLGIVSYSKASSGMTEKYESTAKTSISMTAKYFGTILSTIQNKAFQLDSDDVFKKYYGGKYEFNRLEQKKRTEEILKKVYSITLSEDSISNVYVLSKSGLGMSTVGEFPTGIYDKVEGKFKPGIYEKFIESDEIKKIDKEDFAWIGEHPYLDEITGGSKDNYCISYVKKIHDEGNAAIGYLIIDVKYNFVKEELREIHIDKESYMGFVSPDHREVFVSS